jgi:hypothetical protein
VVKKQVLSSPRLRSAFSVGCDSLVFWFSSAPSAASTRAVSHTPLRLSFTGEKKTKGAERFKEKGLHYLWNRYKKTVS